MGAKSREKARDRTRDWPSGHRVRLIVLVLQTGLSRSILNPDLLQKFPYKTSVFIRWLLFCVVVCCYCFTLRLEELDQLDTVALSVNRTLGLMDDNDKKLETMSSLCLGPSICEL